MLLMSRAGVGWAMVSRISKPRLGNSVCISLARPLPNRPSSWTRTTVLAGLPAASFRVDQVVDARPSTPCRSPARSGTYWSGRERRSLSDDARRRRRKEGSVAGRRLGWRRGRSGSRSRRATAQTPSPCMRSTSATPAIRASSGRHRRPCRSWPRPCRRMPPPALISSMANWAPRRPSSPSCARDAGHGLQDAEFDGGRLGARGSAGADERWRWR